MPSYHSEWETHTEIVRNKIGTDLGTIILKVCSEEREKKAF